MGFLKSALFHNTTDIICDDIVKLPPEQSLVQITCVQSGKEYDRIIKLKYARQIECNDVNTHR